MTPAPRTNPLDKVIELYPKLPDSEIAKKLNVKVSYVRNVGGRYKLKKNYHWSRKEISIVKKWYLNGIAAVNEQLEENGFPKRTRWAIINLYREKTGKKTSSRKPEK